MTSRGIDLGFSYGRIPLTDLGMVYRTEIRPNMQSNFLVLYVLKYGLPNCLSSWHSACDLNHHIFGELCIIFRTRASPYRS